MNGFWMTFWSALLGLTLLAYAGLVLVVMFGGIQDIKSMFRKLRDQDRED